MSAVGVGARRSMSLCPASLDEAEVNCVDFSVEMADTLTSDDELELSEETTSVERDELVIIRTVDPTPCLRPSHSRTPRRTRTACDAAGDGWCEYTEQ